MAPITILIVDDHGVLRAGLRALLNAEADLQVIGEAAHSGEALRLVENLQPQMVIMDISMPGMDGIEATRQLVQRYPQIRVLLLTIHEDKSLIRAAMQAGAAGYILKQAVDTELIEAIRQLSAGKQYVHPLLLNALLEETSPPEVKRVEVTLTLRETQILRLIAAGYTNRAIAEELVLSIRTVETHRANLINKLGLHSRVELVKYATEHGVI